MGSRSKLKLLEAGMNVEDDQGTTWEIGKPIGHGGFGDTYAVRTPGTKSFTYALKLGVGNKVFFNEFMFYANKLTLASIKSYKEQKKLQRLGVVNLMGYGSVEKQEETFCFLVMPRFCSDLARVMKKDARGHCSELAAYSIARQMLDVIEFFHELGYAHCDIKASNIVLSNLNAEKAEAFLIDFGLVRQLVSRTSEKKRAENYCGTVKYSSRDLHYGLITRCSDLEILGYNMIEWMGGELPWPGSAVDSKGIQAIFAKKWDFMKNIEAQLATMFEGREVPEPLMQFMKHVASIGCYDLPKYDYLKQILSMGINKLSNRKSTMDLTK